MLKSSLCNYSDPYILVKGTITLVRVGADTAERQADRNNKQVIFKNCASFTDCIMLIMIKWYNLIEYSHNYSKKSGSSYQFCRDDQKIL